MLEKEEKLLSIYRVLKQGTPLENCSTIEFIKLTRTIWYEVNLSLVVNVESTNLGLAS